MFSLLRTDTVTPTLLLASLLHSPFSRPSALGILNKWSRTPIAEPTNHVHFLRSETLLRRDVNLVCHGTIFVFAAASLLSVDLRVSSAKKTSISASSLRDDEQVVRVPSARPLQPLRPC
ncbi:hypothetical protein VTK56DRAFT_9887 [Thermocarpiscus australiensis]